MWCNINGNKVLQSGKQYGSFMCPGILMFLNHANNDIFSTVRCSNTDRYTSLKIFSHFLGTSTSIACLLHELPWAALSCIGQVVVISGCSLSVPLSALMNIFWIQLSSNELLLLFLASLFCAALGNSECQWSIYWCIWYVHLSYITLSLKMTWKTSTAPN